MSIFDQNALVEITEVAVVDTAVLAPGVEIVEIFGGPPGPAGPTGPTTVTANVDPSDNSVLLVTLAPTVYVDLSDSTVLVIA